MTMCSQCVQFWKVVSSFGDYDYILYNSDLSLDLSLSLGLASRSRALSPKNPQNCGSGEGAAGGGEIYHTPER